MNKKYDKYLPFLDRFPYILFIIILALSLISFFIVRNNLKLDFFSGAVEVSETEEEFSVFITSPAKNKIYDFINQNETVPIEIKAKEAENTGYSISVLIDEKEVKVFNSPPYEFNWNPNISGEYEIMANLLDEDGNLLSSSNKVTFLVEYDLDTTESNIISVDVEEKKNLILSQATYRSQNTIPVGLPMFSYKCYTPPVIDGSFTEWDKFEKFSSFEPTVLKENYTSHNDISATFYSSWDDDNFYFVVQVVDDVFNQPYTSNQLNKGDSVTIVFDTEMEEDMQIPFYNSDDYQIDFSPGNFSDRPTESFMNWPSNAPPREVVIASNRLANGYLIEASIPWYNFINYIPEDGDVLGFTISILDTDNQDSTELVISSSSVFDFNNVSTLGAIVLIDAGDLQGTTEEEPAPEDEAAGE